MEPNRMQGGRFKKLPLQLDSELAIHSASSSAHHARSKILGAVLNDFIMIEEPVFSISDRLAAVVEDDYVCSFCQEGFLYKFTSRRRQAIMRGIIAIDYPSEYEVRQLRKHHRVKVNIAAQLEVAFGDEGEPIRGNMKDISDGGCLVVLPTIVSFMKGTPASLTFTLPDDQVVKALKCKVMNIHHSHIKRCTGIGLNFSEPETELGKVRKFCDFCKRFRV
jgi:c-di-GMP-binding flagellar brake protein YcgR